ncbi:MAG: STAS-like domain-containing protein [Bryobacteraceae bacterium]|nr:STAS-like domain-containing protein [Bryobacteraceae bacterium]
MQDVKQTLTLRIADCFSKSPGPRFRVEGTFSGEAFRDEILEPAFVEAVNDHAVLLIDLDGGYGYATSFLEEAFGGLARKHGQRLVNDTLDFVSKDEPNLVKDIRSYIKQANG